MYWLSEWSDGSFVNPFFDCGDVSDPIEQIGYLRALGQSIRHSETSVMRQFYNVNQSMEIRDLS